MSDASEVRWLDLPAGRFRALEWAGAEPAAIFLHGLTGVAEVWGPTAKRLTGGRRLVALDQRGHGQSVKPELGYSAGAFVSDLLGAIASLGLDRPHLVGHSMGARVAMVVAAKNPGRFRSVTIVDIGPEEWRANWRDTVAAFDRLPPSWPDVESAIGGAGRSRGGESVDATLASSDELREVALARLVDLPEGGVRRLADVQALKETVRTQRSRNYWREWEALQPPALFIRGAESREVRPWVAEAMRRRNPGPNYEELAGVGHNVPLLAPGKLAAVLEAFWKSVEAGSSYKGA